MSPRLRADRLPALRGLPRNARNAILTEPLWAVFGTVVLYYAPLYLRGLGLSSPQIGLLGSLTLALSFAFQTVAAPVTNRFGRKRTTLVGDLISWSLPMFLWAAASSFLTLALAAALNAVNRIVSVSWSLLVIEDVREEERPRVFGLLNLIVTVCGLATPLVGLLIARAGLVPTLRVFYALGGAGMTVMFFWRDAITSESASGLSAIRRHRAMSLPETLRHTAQAVAGMRGHPGLLGVTAFYVLTVFAEQLSLFQILFLGETLHYGAGPLSFVPVVGALVTALLFWLALPRLARWRTGRVLVAVRLLAFVASLLLLLLPAGQVPLMLAVVGVVGGGTFLTQTYRDAAVFARIPGTAAPELYSAVQTLTLLATIPASAIAGVVFAAAPRGLFLLISGLCLVTLGLASWLHRREQART